jgi:mannose-1-phosphate guanylyltransferase
MSNDVHVVVMAGGSGTRFWPASRGHRPKQFLSIAGEGSLLRQTVLRVAPMVPWSRVWVVTGAAHAAHVREEVPELLAENVLVEPAARNTAPCIGWATRTIRARHGEARLVVLPADHFVPDADHFRRDLGLALEAARGGHVVLLGLVPTRPETGYGYIERGAPIHDAGKTPGDAEAGGGLGQVHAVARFVEKPDHARALAYLAGGRHLWNAGIFVFDAAAMDDAIRRHLPALAEGLDRLDAAPGALAELYPTLPSISIDYGVMEREPGIRVIPVQFPWSDVGSWDAAYEEATKDADGNALLGDAIAHAAKGTLVDARSGRVVAIVGVEDLVVVDTPDAVLVARRGQTQDVKHVVTALERAGRRGLL